MSFAGLTLRLAPSDPVVERYEAVGAVLDMIAALFGKAEPTNHREFEADFQALGSTLETKTKEFLAVARNRVGPDAAMPPRASTSE